LAVVIEARDDRGVDGVQDGGERPVGWHQPIDVPAGKGVEDVSGGAASVDGEVVFDGPGVEDIERRRYSRRKVVGLALLVMSTTGTISTSSSMSSVEISTSPWSCSRRHL
jgi:hypothetical protein